MNDNGLLLWRRCLAIGWGAVIGMLFSAYLIAAVLDEPEKGAFGVPLTFAVIIGVIMIIASAIYGAYLAGRASA